MPTCHHRQVLTTVAVAVGEVVQEAGQRAGKTPEAEAVKEVEGVFPWSNKDSAQSLEYDYAVKGKNQEYRHHATGCQLCCRLCYTVLSGMTND